MGRLTPTALRLGLRLRLANAKVRDTVNPALDDLLHAVRYYPGGVRTCSHGPSVGSYCRRARALWYTGACHGAVLGTVLSSLPPSAVHWANARFLYEKYDFRRYESGQPIVFSDAYIIAVLQSVYMWRMLQFCGRSGPTGTFGNSVPRTKRRAQAVHALGCMPPETVCVLLGDLQGMEQKNVARKVGSPKNSLFWPDECQQKRLLYVRW